MHSIITSIIENILKLDTSHVDIIMVFILLAILVVLLLILVPGSSALM